MEFRKPGILPFRELNPSPQENITSQYHREAIQSMHPHLNARYSTVGDRRIRIET